MTKDFLFFNYSFVPNSTFYFESFGTKGHSLDIVTEKTLSTFVPSCEYKNVVIYLHEPYTIPYTEHWLNTHCKNSVLIQHDDTDHEDIQVWTSRKPDLVMHREYTQNTKNHRDCNVGTFHFPIESWHDSSVTEKPYDVCFLGNMTNPRRVRFADKLLELMTGRLSHLKWKVNIEPHVNTPSSLYGINRFLPQGESTRSIVNKTKIGLNDFGNSYEQWRTWEYASAGIAILSPKMRTKCLTESQYMPFNEYLDFSDDYSDIGDKIEYLLENDTYKQYGCSAKTAYDDRHTPEKCFEKYYEQVMRYART
jgi:hypothetical protein